MIGESYAGTFECKLEKSKDAAVIKFLKEIRTRKPDGYDFFDEGWSHEDYEQKLKDYEEGNLVQELTIYRLMRNITEVQDELLIGMSGLLL